MEVVTQSVGEMLALGASVGAALHGGEVLELVGDVGTGKTTFTKGLARGLGIDEADVQSPSFTISRTYAARDGLELHHYDFYRLPDPGIMQYDLAESTGDAKVVTVIEWAETVTDSLPKSRTQLLFAYDKNSNEHQRKVTLQSKDSGEEEAYAAWHQN